MVILITNDDGVHSDGITALKDALSPGNVVYVMAPERERTCVAHAITLHKPLRIREHGGDVFSSNGTPADCVLLGIKTIMPRKPDFIVSGINKGPNMGQDVNYSGTVAAAKEGASLGIPSLAVSLCAREDFRFHDAALCVVDIIERLRHKEMPQGVFLNVNIPNIPSRELKGFMVTSLGKRIYNEVVVERVDPRGGKYYWIGGNGVSCEYTPGSDFSATEKGYISLTPLGLDTTCYQTLNLFETLFT